MKKQIKNKKAGFTLIELLVVILIIGVLSTITVMAINQARKKARDTKRYSDIATIRKALEMYHLDHGDYPNGEGVQHSGVSNFLEDLDKYLSKIPRDPINFNNYYYYAYISMSEYESWCGIKKPSYILTIGNLELSSVRPNPDNIILDCVKNSTLGTQAINNSDYVVSAP